MADHQQLRGNVGQSLPEPWKEPTADIVILDFGFQSWERIHFSGVKHPLPPPGCSALFWQPPENNTVGKLGFDSRSPSSVWEFFMDTATTQPGLPHGLPRCKLFLEILPMMIPQRLSLELMSYKAACLLRVSCSSVFLCFACPVVHACHPLLSE